MQNSPHRSLPISSSSYFRYLSISFLSCVSTDSTMTWKPIEGCFQLHYSLYPSRLLNLAHGHLQAVFAAFSSFSATIDFASKTSRVSRAPLQQWQRATTAAKCIANPEQGCKPHSPSSAPELATSVNQTWIHHSETSWDRPATDAG